MEFDVQTGIVRLVVGNVALPSEREDGNLPQLPTVDTNLEIAPQEPPLTTTSGVVSSEVEEPVEQLLDEAPQVVKVGRGNLSEKLFKELFGEANGHS